MSQKNKYYLVALPENKVLSKALELQSRFSKRYKVYNPPFPSVHVTLGIIYSSDTNELEKATKLLEIVLPKYLPFQLKVIGRSCFSPPHKSLNLAVAPSQKLFQISQDIISNLRRINIKTHPMEEWDYHISLVNTVFAEREWTEEEYLEACDILKEEDLNMSCSIKTIELWSPDFPPLKVITKIEKR